MGKKTTSSSKSAKAASAQTQGSQSFSSTSTAGGNSSSCPRRKRTQKPCDFDSLKLEEQRDQTPTYKVVKSGSGLMGYSLQPDPAKPTRGPWIIKPDHAVRPPERLTSSLILQVVAGAKAGKKKTWITATMQGGPGYCGSANKHPGLTVSTDTGKPPSRSQYKFQVYRPDRAYEKDPSGICDAMLSPFWFADLAPTSLTVVADACGRRDSGSATTSVGTVIEVFPHDIFSLTVKLPPLYKKTYERSAQVKYAKSPEELGGDGKTRALITERSTEKSTTSYNPLKGKSEDKSSHSVANFYQDGSQVGITSSRERTGPGMVDKTELKGNKQFGEAFQTTEFSSTRGEGKSAVETKMSEAGTEVKPVDIKDQPSNLTIELKRNGETDESAQNLMKIGEFCFNVAKNVKEAWNAIQNWTPQVGWKFELEAGFFEGSLVGSWGWKEHTDERVFFYYCVSLAMKVFSVSARVKFGITASVWKLTLEAIISGGVEGECTIEKKLERSKPDDPEHEPITANVGIKADLEAHITCGNPDYLHASGKVSIAWEVESKFIVSSKDKDGPHCEYKVEFKGIEFNGIVVVKGWVRKPVKVEIVKASEDPLLKGRFPAADPMAIS